MKIALFGLTGFGNAALRALLQAGHPPQVVVTRPELGPYPYYPESDLSEEARAAGLSVAFGADGEKLVKNGQFDLILVASYHRKIGEELIACADQAVNFHPSLLPKYRGASPCYWTIRNGETVSGVSAHLLTEAFDAGEIIAQKSVEIEALETQGTLRLKLAKLTEELVKSFVIGVSKKESISSQIQDEKKATEAPRWNERERVLDLNCTFVDLERHVRALTPWPLPLFQDKLIKSLDHVEMCSDRVTQPEILLADDRHFRCRIQDAELDLTF